VLATDAIRLSREGSYRELRRERASQELDGFPRQEMRSARAFVSSARLTSFPLCLLDDKAILSLLGNTIKTGHVVALRADAKAATGTKNATAEQRRLIASIEAKIRGGLNYQGRQYKVVADVDLAGMPLRDSYYVVKHDEAVQVLDGLANQLGQGPEVAPLFAKARGLLTADWGPPFPPDGLILLRRLPRVASTPDTSAPITPSQMKALMEQQSAATLEIVVLDMEDKSFEDIQFTFAAPDDEDHEGELGPSGRTKITSSKPGAGIVTLTWKKPKAKS
jgi:hypothetical protein